MPHCDISGLLHDEPVSLSLTDQRCWATTGGTSARKAAKLRCIYQKPIFKPEIKNKQRNSYTLLSTRTITELRCVNRGGKCSGNITFIQYTIQALFNFMSWRLEHWIGSYLWCWGLIQDKLNRTDGGWWWMLVEHFLLTLHDKIWDKTQRRKKNKTFTQKTGWSSLEQQHDETF